ncbi:unnamed protein product [Allacma fusca]|uniref:Uncharacterized protein n=1 Tax=Allacma fusca TaxID=39272 RepID=A0A8J2KVT5_9HEXA|nr:unnamed protein product [Allacma fusca]
MRKSQKAILADTSSIKTELASLNVTVELHTNSIKKLERRIDVMSSKTERDLAHLRNDVLALRNKDRLNAIIITGNLSTETSSQKVQEEISLVVRLILKHDTDALDKIPLRTETMKMKWGSNSYAIKCGFDSISFVSKLTKNSCELKDTPFKLQPDLTLEQRKIKQELWCVGQNLQKSEGKTPHLKSRRYLVMKGQTNGEHTYYESGSFHTSGLIGQIYFSGACCFVALS